MKSRWGLGISLVFAHTLNSSGVVSMALAVIITLWKLGSLPYLLFRMSSFEGNGEKDHALLPGRIHFRICIFCCKYFVLGHRNDIFPLSPLANAITF